MVGSIIPKKALFQQICVQDTTKCEVYDRCTDLFVVDTTHFQYLNEFLDTKRIEGKSDGTIKRYFYEISKLLSYYHKPLTDYTTTDLLVYLDYRKRFCKYKKMLSNMTLDGMRRGVCKYEVCI